MTPLILFPSEPFAPKQVEPDYAEEHAAATSAGFQTALIDHMALGEGDLKTAIARVPKGAGNALMRGWMVTVGQYRKLEEALGERGVSLMTQSEQYERCHHLPTSYATIEGQTPESAWTTGGTAPTDDDIVRCAAELGTGPAMVKDYVKSQKHAWEDACFIPELSDTDGLLRVVHRFIELQGDSLAGGVVLRRYVPLRITAKHPESGMPLAAEFRIFWASHKPILAHKYWADLVPIDTTAPTDRFADLARRIDSPFFTMDVAQLEDGSWTVVELGDGQVAGLPDRALAGEFYSALARTLGSQ